MIELYSVIYNKLKEYTDRVFEVNNVPQDTVFPYITFYMPSVSDIEQMDRIIIEINIWDRNKSGYDVLTVIETLTDDIHNGVKKYKYIDSNIAVRFEFVNRLVYNNPEPEDKNVCRRELRFEARTFFTN